jgi:hypothetical protein
MIFIIIVIVITFSVRVSVTMAIVNIICVVSMRVIVGGGITAVTSVGVRINLGYQGKFCTYLINIWHLTRIFGFVRFQVTRESNS